MLRCLLIPITCLTLMSASTISLAQARPRDDRKTLSVTGTGESQSRPDLAYVTVGVSTEARTAQEAAQQNAEATAKVVSALRERGIAERDIQTSNYSVQPRYDNRPGSEPTIVGYVVNNMVRATIRKLEQVGAAIDTALSAGANNVQGVSFGLDDSDAAEDAALRDAVRDARRRAEVLATAAGVRLQGVRRIEEQSDARPMPRMMEARMAMAGAATPISPGELTVRATVSVVFDIGPGTGRQGATPRRQRAGARTR